MTRARGGYSGLQIGLHWLIAALVVAAWLTHDGMDDALEMRIEAGRSGIEGNTAHVWLGGAVLALMVLRLLVRLVQGAPDVPEGTPPLLAACAV